MNFISNSIKFTFEGYIQIAVKEIDQKTIEFKIKDTGVGMSKQAKENLFSLFNQNLEHENINKLGSGLGLCICQKLVEKLNG